MSAMQIKIIIVLVTGLLISVISIPRLRTNAPTPKPRTEKMLPTENWLHEPISPIIAQANLDLRKVTLGEKLFHEKRLSKTDEVACSSCHNLTQGGADHLPKSLGINNRLGQRNTPTIFNVDHNFKQFWDGRADDLEKQLDGPIHNPNEMGASWKLIEEKLKREQGYLDEFSTIYPDGIRAENIKDAIIEYEKSLSTPNSRFDKYLMGKLDSITEEEKKGYARFKELGCIGCHQGANVGGNLFQKFGVMLDVQAGIVNQKELDYGRYQITKNETDRFVFKVPGLRNVAMTAPYFHDGSVATLEDAVKQMGKYQLGQNLSAEDIRLIVIFLRTLNGEYKR